MSLPPVRESVDRPLVWPRLLLNKGSSASLGMTIVFLSVLIGGATGLGVIFFHYAIDAANSWSDELLVDTPRRWYPISKYWLLPLVPMAGGAIVGLMRWLWQDFGPNMKSMVTATQTGEKIAPWRGAIKTLAASVSLGTGASLGPEGPSVEIGANVGLFIGQILHASQERQRLLLGAGAAAGIAAGFNAPIAGVFFALELVLGATFATSTISVVVLAAVVASLVAQMGLGAKPAFALPVYQVKSLFELPLYLVLGGLASLVSIAYTQSVQWSRSAFAGKLPKLEWLGAIPPWLSPIIGGAVVGLVALQFPQIKGIGYETVEAILQGVEFSLPLLVSILIVKLIMTAFSLGSGLVGGLFAPSMFLGACLGTIYAKGLVLFFPALTSQIAAPPAYAMVGMAAVLASSARCPLTAILLMFELTRDYRIVLPVMACVGLSNWAVERMQPKPESSEKLAQIGVSVQPDRHLELMRTLSVADVMEREYLEISAEDSIVAAGWQLTAAKAHSAAITNELGLPVGTITLNDVTTYLSKNPNPTPAPTVGKVCTKNLIYAYNDEPLNTAVERMTAKGLHQLPVLDRLQPDRVIGILHQDRIALTCDIIATQQALAEYTKSIDLPELSIDLHRSRLSSTIDRL